MKKRYQVFFTSTDRDGKLTRFSFSNTHVKIAIASAVFFLVCIAVVTVDYSLSVAHQSELKKLRSENEELRQYLEKVNQQAVRFESTLQKLEDFSFKLKSITKSHSSSLSIGPLPSSYHHLHNDQEFAPVNHPVSKDSNAVSNSSKKSLLDRIKSIRLDDFFTSLERRSSVLLRDIWTMIGVLEENKHLVAYTPSIGPAKGRVTSRFGYRDHPVSSFDDGSGLIYYRTHLHKGLDIANVVGTPVIAPADARVSSVGYDKSTGNYVILNHGYRLTTLYGHLHQIHVQKNQKVYRGDLIGKMGNTGRSTGPHLHYEVRIAGQAVDPEYYILDFL